MASVSFIKQFFAILLLTHSSIGTSCGSPKTSQQAPNYRSWQVSIVYSDQQDQINPLQCSGTILNDRFVITAAHCLFDLNGDSVPLPMLQIQSVNNVAINRSIVKMYNPKKFNIERMDDDIVLLKLDRPFTFNSYVSPICFDYNMLVSHSGKFALAESYLEARSEMDVVDLSILTTPSCNNINSLIFKTNYEYSLCVGEFEASHTYHRKAGMALMIKANDTLFIGGVVLYTTGSPHGNISFAGGINLAPYAVWIDKVINRHLRPSVSEQKCQEYNVEAAANKERTMWIPSVLLLDESFDFFNPACFASLISEKFLLTAAKCKPLTRAILIQYYAWDTERFNEFEFFTKPAEPNGIALVELSKKPRRFHLLINCLWTEEETPVQFVAQVTHKLGQHMEDYFRIEYIPRTVYIQYDVLDTERFNEFKFFTMPTEPNGIALVEIPKKPRRFSLLINCLWTKEEIPVKFVSQIKHVLGHTMEDYFRAEYIPPKTIKLFDIKQCDFISSVMIRSAPGDVVALNRTNETLRRLIGLSINGFGRCDDRSVECIVEKLEWIEGIVWRS